MTIRQTAKWLIAIVLLAGLGGAGYGYLWLTQADEVLRERLLEKQRALAPDWDVTVGRAHFDWRRRIHIYDVAVKARGQARPVATFPEIVLTVDREKLSEQQQVEVERVRLIRPVLDLARDRAGRWNWQALLTLKPTDKPCPDWDVEQGTVNIALDQGPNVSPARTVLKNADLQLIPSGKREFLVKGVSLLEGAGQLTINGEWRLDAKSWSVNGRISDITAVRDVLALAADWSPEVRSGLLRAGEALRRFDPTATAAASPVAPPFATGLPANPPPVEVPDFGILGTFDLDFRLEDAGLDVPLDYKLLAHVRQAQVRNAALPFAVHDMQGKIYADPGQVIIRDLTGRYGTTRVSLEGEFDRRSDGLPGAVEIAVRNLELNERLRSRLPDVIRKQYDLLRVSGHCDLRGTLRRDGTGEWQPRGFVLTARNCAIAHGRFPYPITGIAGTIEQEDDRLRISMTGQAARCPARLIGYVRNPGPAAEAAFEATVRQLPIDSHLIDACPPASQKILRDLRLQGTIDATVTIVRPAGLYREYETEIVARLNECDMEYAEFPYRLEKLTGVARFDSVGDVWTFSELRARHGTTKLSGTGRYVLNGATAGLGLRVAMQDGHFDRELELALPESLQTIWADYLPTGTFNASIDLVWTPAGGLSIDVPAAELDRAGLTLKVLPYPLEDVRARLSYVNDRLEVQSFSARHDEMQVRGRVLAVLPPAGEWRVRVEDFYADDLVPDRSFRRALPPDLRTVVEELNPRGRLSLSGTLEFRGLVGSPGPVTAAWDLNTVFSGGNLRAGVELEDISGAVTAQGTWDGANVSTSGVIDLESVTVLGHQFTQVSGPYRLKEGGELIVGSREALLPTRVGQDVPAIPKEERLSARAIGGIVTLDAAARLQGDPGYHLLVTLSHGRLEEYARRYLQGTRNLAGIMNGWIDLSSERGVSPRQMKGRGKLEIRPAALYELPIIMQMFQVLSFTPADKSMFKYAFLDFEVANEQFRFKTIDLFGDAISFRGRGKVGFDGRLALDFYSMMPRNRLPIPVVKPLVDAVLDEATTGWVGIEVSGRLSQPVAKLNAVPVVDEAIKRFLSAFQPPPPGSAPQFVRPVLPPSQTAPPRVRSGR